MHVKDWVRSKRIARLNREIALLESMDARLLRQAWYYITAQLIGYLIFAVLTFYLLSSTGQPFGLSFIISIALTGIVALTFRYPLAFFFILTGILMSILLAALSNGGWPLEALNFDSGNSQTTAKPKLKTKPTTRDKVQSAIAKRTALVGKLLNP